MRFVTICENLGPRKVPGADHDKKYDAYALAPGTAWKIDDVGRDHHVVPVKDAKAAKYKWEMRWIDGRTVAVFELGGESYAQPVTDDPRAKEKRLGSTHKVRKPRREAPGVAPEAPGAEEPPIKSARTRYKALEGESHERGTPKCATRRAKVKKFRTLEPL